MSALFLRLDGHAAGDRHRFAGLQHATEAPPGAVRAAVVPHLPAIPRELEDAVHAGHGGQLRVGDLGNRFLI